MIEKILKATAAGFVLTFAGATLPATHLLAQPDPAANQAPQMKSDNSDKPGKGGKGLKHFKGMRGKWMKDLDLTDDQKAKINDIHKKARDQVKGLREQMRAKHDALKALIVGDSTPEAIRAAHAEAQDVRRKLDDLHFESTLEIRGILTAEQRKKFGESMGPGGRGPRGRGGPGGPGEWNDSEAD